MADHNRELKFNELKFFSTRFDFFDVEQRRNVLQFFDVVLNFPIRDFEHSSFLVDNLSARDTINHRVIQVIASCLHAARVYKAQV